MIPIPSAVPAAGAQLYSGFWGIHLTRVSGVRLGDDGSPSRRCALSEIRGRSSRHGPERRGLPGLPRHPSGAADDAHLANYLNEFVFGFNRRRSRNPGMLFFRVLELAVANDPVRYHDLIASRRPPESPANTATRACGAPAELGAATSEPPVENGIGILRLNGYPR